MGISGLPRAFKWHPEKWGDLKMADIQFTTGDIFAADVEALVNPVNCVGVMGAGLALEFKKRFPGNFDAYYIRHLSKGIHPGMTYCFKTGTLKNPVFIINFPTKRHWSDKSRMEDIESGLMVLIVCIKEFDIRSIAIPALGCGLGGLNWANVRPRIVDALSGIYDLRVIIFEPLNDGP